MSWRYWSKAVDGDERKKPLDLLSAVVCIHIPCGELSGKRSKSVAIYHPKRTIISGLCPSQQPRFMPDKNPCFYGVVGGSLVFVRLVPVRIPMPSSTITPTPIHKSGTPS